MNHKTPHDALLHKQGHLKSKLEGGEREGVKNIEIVCDKERRST